MYTLLLILKNMNKYMELAINEAEKGVQKKEGGPFGAVIIKNSKIISSAHNTVIKNNDPTCHAEINAIRKATKVLKNFNLSGCELYTTGKPCPMCRSAIKWAKIKKVYYACDYKDAKDIGFEENDGNSSEYTEKKIDSKECKQLYQRYKNSKPKKY